MSEAIKTLPDVSYIWHWWRHSGLTSKLRWVESLLSEINQVEVKVKDHAEWKGSSVMDRILSWTRIRTFVVSCVLMTACWDLTNTRISQGREVSSWRQPCRPGRWVLNLAWCGVSRNMTESHRGGNTRQHMTLSLPDFWYIYSEINPPPFPPTDPKRLPQTFRTAF